MYGVMSCSSLLGVNYLASGHYVHTDLLSLKKNIETLDLWVYEYW